ncbi:kunitz-type trypsin inhibitor alpha chain [Beta vulgaris subsp. vulgaris]|uniref:kunitz-type trypsin inhibitor alpha chain n=1 Tax=Beta vulgaris subsp. vulgaris TaxID=3555 RepID=UPI002036AF31|nr:kunitz-type trypsin inhibitor alpha chain [Beta vulgaris subsp. vulgaris]
MASIFLKQTITLLLIFSALSISIASILDTDGEPLVNGGQYYIIPQSAGIMGRGLTLISKPDASPCPLHITRDKDETSLGIPVTITSPFKVEFITDSVPINIVFKDTPNICVQSLAWQMIPDETTGQFYVATGGSGFLPTESFMVVKIGDKNVYKMRYIGEFDETLYIGIFKKDGLLGSTNEIPLPVVFKKTSFDVLRMTN